MAIRELPPRQWPHFFDEFSRRYGGRAVTVEHRDRELGSRLLAHRVTLLGVTVATGDGPSGIASIRIMAGGPPREHVMQVIDAPVRVRVGIACDGADEVVIIESAGGTTTVECDGEQARILRESALAGAVGPDRFDPARLPALSPRAAPGKAIPDRPASRR